MSKKTFILDVDGVMTDGKIYCGPDGKMFKVFGNYDHDGLKILKDHVNIEFITADGSGWDITYNRITNHMGYKLNFVPESIRYDFVKEFGFENTFFMGDGPYDAKVIEAASIGIAPAQAWNTAKAAANYVTPRAGGEGAVMDACVYLMNRLNIPHVFDTLR